MSYDNHPYLDKLLKALDVFHATDCVVINVKEKTSIADYLVICSARSSRHVKAVAEQTLTFMKESGFPVINHNGLDSADWAVIDLGDVIVHIMQPDARAFYNLEGLWNTEPC